MARLEDLQGGTSRRTKKVAGKSTALRENDWSRTPKPACPPPPQHRRRHGDNTIIEESSTEEDVAVKLTSSQSRRQQRAPSAPIASRSSTAEETRTTLTEDTTTTSSTTKESPQLRPTMARHSKSTRVPKASVPVLARASTAPVQHKHRHYRYEQEEEDDDEEEEELVVPAPKSDSRSRPSGSRRDYRSTPDSRRSPRTSISDEDEDTDVTSASSEEEEEVRRPRARDKAVHKSSMRHPPPPQKHKSRRSAVVYEEVDSAERATSRFAPSIEEPESPPRGPSRAQSRAPPSRGSPSRHGSPSRSRRSVSRPALVRRRSPSRQPTNRSVSRPPIESRSASRHPVVRRSMSLGRRSPSRARSPSRMRSPSRSRRSPSRARSQSRAPREREIYRRPRLEAEEYLPPSRPVSRPASLDGDRSRSRPRRPSGKYYESEGPSRPPSSLKKSHTTGASRMLPSRAQSVSSMYHGNFFGRPSLEEEAYEKPRRSYAACVACMEEKPPHKTAQLSCGHSMCHSCLKRSFTLSISDPQHMPPRCCTSDVISLRHVEKLFDPSFKQQWNRKFAEYSTRNRVYCPSRRCGEWIRPEDIRRSEDGRKVGKCARCRTKVCGRCSGRWHAGVCPRDEDTAMFLEQAKREGWQRCYRCKHMVELKEGCVHMICRCGAAFCMTCGSKWKSCDCPWFNDEPLEDEDPLEQMGIPGGSRQNPFAGGARYPPERSSRYDAAPLYDAPPSPRFDGGPPSPRDYRSEVGPPASAAVRPRPSSYEEEMLLHKLQEDRDEHLARRMQHPYDDEDIDHDFDRDMENDFLGLGHREPADRGRVKDEYNDYRRRPRNIEVPAPPPPPLPMDPPSHPSYERAASYVSGVNRARGMRPPSPETRWRAAPSPERRPSPERGWGRPPSPERFDKPVRRSSSLERRLAGRFKAADHGGRQQYSASHVGVSMHHHHMGGPPMPGAAMPTPMSPPMRAPAVPHGHPPPHHPSHAHMHNPYVHPTGLSVSAPLPMVPVPPPSAAPNAHHFRRPGGAGMMPPEPEMDVYTSSRSSEPSGRHHHNHHHSHSYHAQPAHVRQPPPPQLHHSHSHQHTHNHNHNHHHQQQLETAASLSAGSPHAPNVRRRPPRGGGDADHHHREHTKEPPKQSVLAGLTGPGRGMNRVFEWRNFVEPGISEPGDSNTSMISEIAPPTVSSVTS